MRLLPTLLALVVVSLPIPGAAQQLPTEPVTLAGGRLVVGGELFVTVGNADPGFFNYTDYEYNALRNLRVAVSTEVRASRRMQVLAEVRLDHGDELSAYALFLRLRPWPSRRFDLQVGRVPPTFGAFTRTIYAYNNLVIGQPLAYQYLLSIRPDAIPASADDLRRMRGRGWLSSFPLGNTAPAPGVPIVNTARYDTGITAHGVVGSLDWTAAVTTGSLSEPRLGDNNGRPQVSGRVLWQVMPAVRLGASGARGAWLDRDVEGSTPGVRAADFRQTAVGLDTEVSHGRWLARAEWLRSTWTVPAVDTPAVQAPLAAQSLIVEGRYRLWPGVSVAARADRLLFSDIATSENATTPWEAGVSRLETAAIASVTRNLTGKLAWQRNRRDGGRVRHDSLLAAQLVYWF